MSWTEVGKNSQVIFNWAEFLENGDKDVMLLIARSISYLLIRDFPDHATFREKSVTWPSRRSLGVSSL